MMDDFDSLFAAEDESSSATAESQDAWKILIVDDEADIHSVIRLALDNFVFQNKRIQFLDAYSGREARTILESHNDIAVILLDVVMENDYAGLDFVKYIRDDLKNQFIRIVLWTGQPGQAPKKEVVLSYEINDYKTKTDLTDENVFTAVLSSIRSYNAMMEIESYRLNLEEKVRERTKTIEEQKNEIEKQKNKITDSIVYAQKIQKSMLPSEKIVKKHFPDSFIFYRAKDIVSGDFYWFSAPETDEWGKPNSKFFIAAADCTGHGVPGALMSMIGNTLLNEIVNGKKIFQPSVILSELNRGIIEALRQNDASEDSQSDGMDLTLCQIDPVHGTIEIACANHIVYVCNKDEITMIEGDIFSIGGLFSIMQKANYTNHKLNFDEHTSVYMFSDGYQDQFGGENNQKFMLGRLKKLLFEIRNKPMSEQYEILKTTHESWRGNNRQIDDILVMGIKLNNLLGED